jgi:hypothetical protein
MTNYIIKNITLGDQKIELLQVKKGSVISFLSEEYQIFEVDNEYVYYWIPIPIKDGYKYNLVYMFWTGDNPLTKSRLDSINQFKAISNARVILITNNMLYRFVPDLHEGYKYLSYTHRSDYLRTYFMHHYGGGYSDIKRTTGSWNESFKKINEETELYGVGYKEVGPWGVVNLPNDEEFTKVLHDNWEKLIGNGAYIFKNNTTFTTEWYSSMKLVMDRKLEELKKNPAKDPRDRNYAIGWCEILGDIFHPLCYKYYDKLSNILPVGIFVNYQ